MIQLHITKTSKSFNPKDKYAIFDKKTKNFPNLEAAKAFVKETYGNSKRSPIFIDDKDGIVIGFKNADWSHSPVQSWLQQDWIEFRESHHLQL